jgi:hypothetical protein
MNGDSVSNQIPSPSLFPLTSHATFRAANEKTMALFNQEISGKSDAAWRPVTIYDAAEQFHVVHLDPLSDD